MTAAAEIAPRARSTRPAPGGWWMTTATASAVWQLPMEWNSVVLYVGFDFRG
uniref:Uncharacterized protein n=1 Tax=Arundo donax TaxID=35708 RepID=A0A0A9AMR9_ARUDO